MWEWMFNNSGFWGRFVQAVSHRVPGWNEAGTVGAPEPCLPCR